MKRPLSSGDAGAGIRAPPPSEPGNGVAAETVPNTGRPGILLAAGLPFRRRSKSVPATTPEVTAHDSDARDFNRILT